MNKSDGGQPDKPSDYVPWDLEAVKQEICDLFARYGSGNYMPTEEEKGIIDTGLDEILTMPPVAQSGDVAPAAVTAAIERMLGYPDGSYMRCPFCGGKSRSMHKDDCAILIVAAALRAPSAGVASVGPFDDALDALVELVRLKRIKERIEHLESLVRNPRAMPPAEVEEAATLRKEYEASKEDAWSFAKSIIDDERGTGRRSAQSANTPIPTKINGGDAPNQYRRGFAAGWNDCVDSMLDAADSKATKA